MSINPQIVKFLKKNAMTTHKCAEILMEAIMDCTYYANVKLMLKYIRKALMREIKRHKNIIICTGDIKQVELYFDNVFHERMEFACRDDDDGTGPTNIITDELYPIFNFTSTYDSGNLWDGINVVIKKYMKYVMLTFMMNKYNKILDRFLLTDMNMIILSYV